jgi:hypothetical protein
VHEGVQIIGLGKVDLEVSLCPRAPQAASDVTFDIEKQGGCEAPYPGKIGPVHGHGELLGDRRDQFVWRLAEMTPEPAVETVETRPQAKPQQCDGVLGPSTATLGLIDQGLENAILFAWIAVFGMKEIEQRELVRIPL